jgi:hypothetical protein
LSANGALPNMALRCADCVRPATAPSATAARALGYADAANLLRQRYVVERATVSELAVALGCAEMTVTAQMDRLGIRRRPQQEQLARGRQMLAGRRAVVRAEREARVRALGFEDLASYLRQRHHDQRWPRGLIADELGVTAPVVARLMRAEGVPGWRGVRAATAHRRPDTGSS